MQTGNFHSKCLCLIKLHMNLAFVTGRVSIISVIGPITTPHKKFAYLWKLKSFISFNCFR